jgi:hypothetical protein
MDVTEDGGVVVASDYKPEAPREAATPGQTATIQYSVKVESDPTQRLVDAHASFSFVLGRGDVVAGLEAAVGAMCVGEVAMVTVRHDYGYGEHGLAGKVPPYSTLIFNVTLTAVADTAAAALGATEMPLQLPPSEPRAERTLTVGGSALKLDYLGPIVINTDGSTSRIANWAEMNAEEQEKTSRLIAKRNQKRLASGGGAAAPPVDS